MLELFFFNDTATTEIYPLSLHDALPIFLQGTIRRAAGADQRHRMQLLPSVQRAGAGIPALRHSPGRKHALPGLRSEEHTSELQSRQYLVCRLLLEKKTAPPLAWIRPSVR